MRKCKIITVEKPKTILTLHETLTLVGALMILVHAGIHLHHTALTSLGYNVDKLYHLKIYLMQVTIPSGAQIKYIGNIRYGKLQLQ